MQTVFRLDFAGFAFYANYNLHFVSNRLGFLHSENIRTFCVITPFNRSTFVFVIFFNTDNATPGVARCLSIGFVGLFALCRKKYGWRYETFLAFLVLSCYPVPAKRSRREQIVLRV